VQQVGFGPIFVIFTASFLSLGVPGRYFHDYVGSDGPYWAATIDAGSKNVGAACGILNTGGSHTFYRVPGRVVCCPLLWVRCRSHRC
jgi:hypothetical protein